MDLIEIIKRNYQATVKRGLINKSTTFIDFYNKLQEEVDELNESNLNSYGSDFDKIELADVILVCLAMSKHYNIDIQKALEEKVKFNEQRK